VNLEQDLPPALRRRLAELGMDFLAGFLEVEVERHPENVAALSELGHVYTRQGRHEHGLAIDRRLVRLAPENPTVHYNLACSLALLDQVAEALDALERAAGLGYDDPGFMLQDEDLSRLHDEERFRDLVRRLESRSR
jgi:tetratricopeptide (TPR) repeat protein